MANGIEVAKAYVTIIPTMAGAQQTITEEMTEAGQTAGDKAGKEAGEHAAKACGKSFGDKMTSVGKTMTAAITAPLVGIGVAAVKKAATYQEALAKVSTIADTAAVPMEEMGAAILNLSNSTGVAASDIAESVYNAISAGQDTADAVSFVGNALSLSRAGFTDAAAATDVLTTALNAYGLEASEVEHVSDVLIGTQNAGKTTVDELARSLGKVIPTAKAAGVGIEDLATQYVALTKNGIATAEATTYINSAFNELSKAETKADKAFKAAAGKSFPAFIKAGGSVSEAMQILKGYADETGLALGDLFGSAEAAKAANVMAGFKEADETLRTLKESTNVTSDALSKLDDTPLHRYQVAQEQVNNLLMTLGADILPMIVPVLETATQFTSKLADGWNNMSDGAKKAVVIGLGVVAAAGPLLIILGKVSNGIGKISGFFTKFGNGAKAAGTAAGSAAAPFSTLAGSALKLVAVGAAFVGIAFGLTLIAKAVKTIAETEGGNKALLVLTGATIGLIAALAIAAPYLQAGVAGIAIFTVAVLGIATAINIAGPYLEDLANGIGVIIDKSGDAAVKIGHAIAEITAVTFQGISVVVDSISNGIATVHTAIANGIATVLDSIGGVFESLGQSAKDAGEGFKSLADGVVNLTQNTGVLDLGGTLLAVATGIGAIMAEAAIGGPALKNVADLGNAFTQLGQTTTAGVDETISAIDRLKMALTNTVFRFPSKLELPHLSATEGTAPYGMGGGTPPAWNVKWYDRGGIFTQPSVIGVGERRPEFVGALDDLRGIVREEAGTRNVNVNGVLRVDGYNNGMRETIVDNLVDILRTEVRLA